MSTAAAPVSQITDRQLPMFEGYRIRVARVAFKGAWEFPLAGPDDVAFADALKMGREMTVVIAIDGHDKEITLGARVTDRGFRFCQREGDETTISRYQVTINHRRPDEAGEGGEGSDD